jgi:hypothetical protein
MHKSLPEGSTDPQRPLREIALMFSGGLDSTTTAVILGRQFDRVHLLTYKNGYGTYGHGRVGKRVEELKKKIGDRYVWGFVSTKSLFENVLVSSVTADYERYKSAFIWCMGCKLSMHTKSVVYCLENGIPFMADGSSGDSQEMVEQMLVSVSMIRFFYEEYGIAFVTPVYDVPRDEEREMLREMGFNMGLQVMGRHMGIQPSCMVGELYYLPYVLFNKSPGHSEEVVAKFIDEKQALCRKHVAEYFAAKGLKVEDLVARIRERAAELGGAEGVMAAAEAQQRDIRLRAQECSLEPLPEGT